MDKNTENLLEDGRRKKRDKYKEAFKKACRFAKDEWKDDKREKKNQPSPEEPQGRLTKNGIIGRVAVATILIFFLFISIRAAVFLTAVCLASTAWADTALTNKMRAAFAAIAIVAFAYLFPEVAGWLKIAALIGIAILSHFFPASAPMAVPEFVQAEEPAE